MDMQVTAEIAEIQIIDSSLKKQSRNFSFSKISSQSQSQFDTIFAELLSLSSDGQIKFPFKDLFGFFSLFVKRPTMTNPDLANPLLANPILANPFCSIFGSGVCHGGALESGATRVGAQTQKKVGPRRVGGSERVEGPEEWEAQNFALFSMSRHNFRSFCLTHCVSSRGFGGFWRRRDHQMFV